MANRRALWQTTRSMKNLRNVAFSNTRSDPRSDPCVVEIRGGALRESICAGEELRSSGVAHVASLAPGYVACDPRLSRRVWTSASTRRIAFVASAGARRRAARDSRGQTSPRALLLDGALRETDASSWPTRCLHGSKRRTHGHARCSLGLRDGRRNRTARPGEPSLQPPRHERLPLPHRDAATVRTPGPGAPAPSTT